MMERKVKPEVLAAFKAAALTVLLQEAIDNSKGTAIWKHDRIMRARALYKSMEKYMLHMYKEADDPMVISFHTLSNILERLVDWLGECETLNEFTQKLDKLSDITDGEYRVFSELPVVPDDTDEVLSRAINDGWSFNPDVNAWQKSGHRDKTSRELYEYIKNYYKL